MILLALALVVTLCLYFPGLSGGFIFDDEPQIKSNQLLAIDAFEYTQLKQAFFSSSDQFPTNRPLSMLSFGVNHVLTGFNPAYFKLTNLAIHLWVGLAIFFLTRLLLSTFAVIQGLDIQQERIAWVGLVVSVAWMLHPINLTPVLYVVQRMTSLSALFSIHALICYVIGRSRMWEGKPGMALIWSGFLLFGSLAFMAKENAALLPLLILSIEFCLFRFAVHSAADRRLLTFFILLTVALPAIAFVLYNAIYPEWVVGGYAARNFSLIERLLTEARVLWFYLGLILAPDPMTLGFFHDDIALSKGLFDPVSTLPALLGIGGLLVIAGSVRSRAPILSFGILFFLIGHSMESTIFSLELVFEHRNYLPVFGPLFALFYYLLHPSVFGLLRTLSAAVAVSFITLFMVITADRASYWGDMAELYLTEAEHHPASPRANFMAGAVYVSRFLEKPDDARIYEQARHQMELVTNLAPANSKGLFGLIILHLHGHRPVPDEWLEKLEYRLRNAPYTPENINSTQFMALVKSQMANHAAKLPKSDVLRIFNAVLSNPTLHRTARAGIHASLAAYYHDVLHQSEQALENARKMMDAWPENLLMRSRLISLLLSQNQFDAARREVKKAEMFKKGNRSVYEITRLKRLIDETEVAAGNRY